MQRTKVLKMIYLTPNDSSGLWNTGFIIDLTYQLAKMLGYEYLANPSRYLVHLPPEDHKEMYRFVGFNLNMPCVTDPAFQDHSVVELDLRTLELPSMTLEHIKESIESIASDPGGNYIFFIKGIPTTYQLSEDWCKAHGHELSDISYDFESRYIQAQNKYFPDFLCQKEHDRDKITVCIQVRRGDTSIIVKDDWVIVNSHEPHKRQIVPQEQFRSDMAQYPHIPIDRFRGVLDKLIDQHGRDKLIVHVCSDGYPSCYFEWVRNDNHMEVLGLSNWDEFTTYLENYEREEFSNNFTDCELIIGESTYKTQQAIHTLTSDDVIIKGAGGFAEFFALRFRSPPPLFIELELTDDVQINQKLIDFASKLSQPR